MAMELTWVALVAGLAHVLAPDHWIPGSLLTWQRRYGGFKTTLLAIALYALHVAVGAAIYFTFARWLNPLEGRPFFQFTVALVALTSTLRGLRVPRIEGVFRTGPTGRWGIWGVFKLLGPAESLIPILIKANHVGSGYALSTVGYFAGTLVAGTALMGVGHQFWNQPLLLPRVLAWSQRKLASLPAAAALAVGLGFLLKLT